MSFKDRFMAVQEAALCLVSKWWRPVTCIGIAGGALINLVVIPLWTWTPIDLTAAAAYIAAATAAFSIRTWEKKIGVAKGFNH